MNSIYKTYSASLIASGDSMSANAIIEIVQAVQHVAIGNSSCSEHAVIALNEVIQGQHLVYKC